MFIKRGIVAGLGALLLSVGTVAITTGVSSALPPGGGGGGGCRPDCPPPPPPPPPPSIPTISSITPSFGWSGDAMTIKGANFTNATLTVQGLSPVISSRSDTQINFTVPTLTSNVSGPLSVPVVVSGPYGTASTSFALSPALTISGGTTFGVNSQFGQGMDGSAWATATVNRFGGTVTATETVSNTQFWQSLTVNVSAVWLDSNNVVVGFTAPQSLTSTGIVLHWPSTAPVVNSYTWTTIMGPNAGAASTVHSGQIVMVRDHGAELLSTLNTAVTVGQTIYQVISALAAFV
jgi:hypothetical protein